MEEETYCNRLSQISTLWSMLQQAHEGSPEQARTACQALLARYGGAVDRYLLAVLGHPKAAEDLYKEFALRFVRGDFRPAGAQGGRFRDYLKAALRDLILGYVAGCARSPEGPGPAAPADSNADSEDPFLPCWREQLLESTWEALLQANPRYHAVLRLQVEHPELSAAQVAEQFTAQMGAPYNAAWVRKTLQRARDKYADLLLEEVAQSLPGVTAEALRQELHDIDLLRYCRTALERWGR
jgi:DNA-directed RNA polymerase specialized sigma24 family protein